MMLSPIDGACKGKVCGSEASWAKRLRSPKEDNARLRRLLADAMLDKAAPSSFKGQL